MTGHKTGYKYINKTISHVFLAFVLRYSKLPKQNVFLIIFTVKELPEKIHLENLKLFCAGV